MTKLGDALKRKFKTPQDALRALGMDAALLAADSKPKEKGMTKVKLSRAAIMVKGAAMAKYAMDGAIIDPIVADLTKANYAVRKPTLAAAIKGLATDATLEDVTLMLDKLEKIEGMDDDPNSSLPAMVDDAELERRCDDARKRLGRDETPEEEEEREEKESAEDSRKRMGRDETPEEMTDRKAKDKKARDSRRAARDAKRAHDAEEAAKKPEMVEKKAMDAAIAAATKIAVDAGKQIAMDAVAAERKNQQAIREAEAFVAPWAGRMRAVAFDSADAVYGAALEAAGVDIKGVHPSAFRAILERLPKAATEGAGNGGRLAMDQSTTASLGERFKHAASIRVTH